MKKAIARLMNDGLMMGRHRKIVADWLRESLTEHRLAITVENPEQVELAKAEVLKQARERLEGLIQVTVKRVPRVKGGLYHPELGEPPATVECNLEVAATLCTVVQE